MSRNEKLSKLGRAYREWRGRYDSRRKRWIEAPKPDALPRVIRWMRELRLATRENVEFLRDLTTEKQFNEWIKAQ